MKEKFISLNSLLLLLTIFASCQTKEKFDWNAGISGPKYYPSGAPSVTYFYKGESLAGASSGTGADQGWGITSGGVTGGESLKPVPDSVYVKWVCGADDLVYKSGFKLPREKMLQLFKTGATDPFGDHVAYTVIITGMAPGGNVCIWLQAGTVLIEVAKYKVKEGVEDSNIDKSYREKDVKRWGNYLSYWKLHGIPYDVWEKGEKEYNYDIGFSSEDGLNTDFRKAVTGVSKDGSVIYADAMGNTLNNVKWLSNNAISLDNPNKNKLPIQLAIQWISPNDSTWYESVAVLPLAFEKQCLKFKKDYGNFMILVLMEKTIPNLDFTYGKIYLINNTEKQLVMRFRAAKLNNSTRNFYVSKYSLPKGFVFPKWQGRNNLTFPELDYWQEQ